MKPIKKDYNDLKGLRRFKKEITQIIFISMLLLPFTNYHLLITDVYAEIPRLINYQGRLTDSQGQPITGAKTLKFRLYNQQSGGSPIWEETQSVTVDKGIFNTLLGGVTTLNLSFGDPYYLEIVVEGEVLSPRQQLASAAYALNGVPEGCIMMWSGSIANIPTGWALCDGTNGTPDLRDKFIVSARQDDGGVAKTNVTGMLTQSGGSATISEANLPTHSHGAGTLAIGGTGDHNHNVQRPNGPTGSSLYFGFENGSTNNSSIGWLINPSGSHTHTVSGSTGSSGSGTPYMPPYYALAFIMKL